MLSMAHQHRPRTPPSGELQYGLHHLLQHNTQTPPSRQHLFAGAETYGSPDLLRQSLSPQSSPYLSHHFDNNAYPDLQGQGDVGLGIQYEGYSVPTNYYPAAPNAFSSNQYLQQVSQSPSTPRSATTSLRRTRALNSPRRSNSPRVISTPTSAARISKSPRTRKAKPAKTNASSKTPELTAPLSILTASLTNVPLRDMEAWVARSSAVRQAEVEKRNGYVTRPMNSFMLYRSAFAERTKAWCTQNNHQVVSSVSGHSWPIETAEVREFYNALARSERENHANAHPGYKFSPSKAGTSSAKGRKGKKEWESDDEDEDNLTEESDKDDPDSAWRPAGERRSARNNQSKNPGTPSARKAKFTTPYNSSPLTLAHQFQESCPFGTPVPNSFNHNALGNVGGWEIEHDNRPIEWFGNGTYYNQPPMISQQQQQFQQLQMMQQRQQQQQMMDDRHRRDMSATPGLMYSHNHVNIPSGVPQSNAGGYQNILHQLQTTQQQNHNHQFQHQPPVHFEPQVDPMLLQLDLDSNREHAQNVSIFDNDVDAFGDALDMEEIVPASQFETAWMDGAI